MGPAFFSIIFNLCAPHHTLRQDELHDIIEACIARKSAAQEKLYKHFFALMYSICKPYAPDRQEVISLVNEGFLKIFLNLPSFDSQKGDFTAWAKRIVSNTCIDYSRRRKAEDVYIPIDEMTSLQQPAEAQDHIQAELHAILRKLPAMTKRVFTLHVFKGYSHKEISRELNMTESTSRWHVMEARKNLKKDVQKII